MMSQREQRSSSGTRTTLPNGDVSGQADGTRRVALRRKHKTIASFLLHHPNTGIKDFPRRNPCPPHLKKVWFEKYYKVPERQGLKKDDRFLSVL